jgi:hypothetical protein
MPDITRIILHKDIYLLCRVVMCINNCALLFYSDKERHAEFIMSIERKMVAELLKSDIADLYIKIGCELQGYTVFPVPQEQLRRIAREWLKKKRHKIANYVCSNETIILLASNTTKKQDKINLILALADLISSLVVGVSPVTVSVLLVREGIKTLCKDFGHLH